jgi:hypothetical protein
MIWEEEEMIERGGRRIRGVVVEEVRRGRLAQKIEE